MASKCTISIEKAEGGYKFTVTCDGEVKACAVRSTKELALTACNRELAVQSQILKKAAGRKPAAKKPTKRK
jgi:hypothetical protein